MREAVEKIVRSLVGEPDAVEVTEFEDGKTVRIEVRVADSDMGRVIGREGRTVKAIRSILFAAGQKHGKRFHLDLVED
ncbi:MAG: KH domain-containing protein [Pyrinomonadaceae bacterium]|nr:KH domain-containing protein [Chloracidobacterium sp.]